MPFRTPCHMPFRKLIPPFTLTDFKETKHYSDNSRAGACPCMKIFSLPPMRVLLKIKIYLHLFIHPSRVYYELTIWPAPSWLDRSLGRVLHRHRRGHGLESRSSLNSFKAFFSQLLKLRSNCEDLSSIWSFIRSSKYTFQIFTFIYSSFTGILRTYNMTRSQFAW